MTLLRKRDVAHQLSVSMRTVDRILKSGELQVVRINGSVRIHSDDLRDYIELKRQESKKEMT